MKYAHLADLHLGSWKEQAMRDLSTKTFLKAIDMCLEKQVDFILFSGDIFNTSLPSLDTLKIVTKKIKELQDSGIPLYVIAGSHDFSPSGKTMIDVLENAGLLMNVCKGSVNTHTKQLDLKFTVDPNTNTKITGIIGRRGMLDRTYYENLNRTPLEQEKGYKIFMFHTTLTELKPKHLEMLDSQPASFLPKGFNYYAGGHIHHKTVVHLREYGPLTYPGALFPNNFAEIEKYSHGGFYIIETDMKITQTIDWLPVIIHTHLSLKKDCTGKTPIEIMQEIETYIETTDIKDTIITIRLYGTIGSGRTTDINFLELYQKFAEKGAYICLKNTTKLISKEFEEIKVSSMDPEHIEEHTIREHIGQLQTFTKDVELPLIKNLLTQLNTTKREGEKVADFENRVHDELNAILVQKKNEDKNISTKTP
jgi:DNA repair protein SbcD/Mre11